MDVAGDTAVPPQLGETRGDVVARTLGVAAGLIPYIGPMLQIALNETIPNARMERIEAYLRHLSERIDEIRLEAALKTPEGLDLFEEGMWQAARALSDDRKQRIATLVATGMGAEEVPGRQSRHFLRILNQLDDTEVIILTSYLDCYQILGAAEVQEFFEMHADILGPFDDSIGGDVLEHSKSALKTSMLNHLVSFGLLRVAGQDWNSNITDFAMTPMGEAFLSYLGVDVG